jgi:hypothetical protein
VRHILEHDHRISLIARIVGDLRRYRRPRHHDDIKPVLLRVVRDEVLDERRRNVAERQQAHTPAATFAHARRSNVGLCDEAVGKRIADALRFGELQGHAAAAPPAAGRARRAFSSKAD